MNHRRKPRVQIASERIILVRIAVLFAVFGLTAPLFANGDDAVSVRYRAEVPDSPGEAALIIEPGPVRWKSTPDGLIYPSIDGFGSMAVSGAPDLPARRERIALSRGASLETTDVLVEWIEESLSGRLATYPAGNPDRPPLDPAIASGVWPDRVAEIVVADGAYRTLRFATVEFRPIQIDIERGVLKRARRIELRFRRSSHTAISAPTNAASGAGSLARRSTESLAHGAAEVTETPMSSLLFDTSPLAPTTAGVDAAGRFPAWQFGVDEDGLYRISYEWAQVNAPDLFSFLTSNDPRQYRMTTQGLDVPILVEGESDGVFGPGDAVVFYGEFIENVDLLDTDVWQSGDNTDRNIYRLNAEPNPLRIGATTGTGFPQGVRQVPSAFRTTVRHEENARFLGFVPEDGIDHWYVDPFVRSPVCVDTSVATCGFPLDAGVCSGCDGPTDQCCAHDVDQFVSTPGHAGGSVGLKVGMLGFIDEFHQSDLLMDGTQVDRAEWDGEVIFVQGVDQGPISYTPTAPLGPDTRVTLRLPLQRNVGGSPIARDTVAYNWIEVDYDRLYQSTDGRLQFDVADGADVEVQLTGFASQPEVWEIGTTSLSPMGMRIVQPDRVTTVGSIAGGYGFEVDQTGAVRRFIAAEPASMLVPALVREDRPPSTLEPGLGDTLKTAFGAHWVVVGERSLITDPTDPSGNTLGVELSNLVSHRQANGCGEENPACQTAVIDIQDVYDDFSEGIVEPQALRDFVAYMLENWSPAPSYLLLVGDGTWDHKNNYGYVPARQFVPNYMFDESANSQFGYYPSDTHFAAVIGNDAIPDLVVGRIPAHTYEEAEVVFAKTTAYENQVLAPSIAAKALLVSEHKEDPTDALGSEFFRVHDEVAADWFQSGPPDQTALKLYELSPYDSGLGCQGTADELNSRIDSAVNSGAALMSFVGHGSFKQWGKSCLFFRDNKPGLADDLDDFNVGSQLLFTIHANCITGNFAADSSQAASPEFDNWYAFVEDWITTSGKGLVGGFAPSHLTYTFELDSIIDTFYEEIFGRTKTRIVGDIDRRLRSVFDSRNNLNDLRSFILQGDPALRLLVPAPPAPDLISVSPAGSGELELQWTAVSNIANYRVYRSTQPNTGYQLVAEPTATTFIDTGLDNCVTYYYYVTATDSDGFESRWSNYNDTCYDDPPGADCRYGTPEDPNPPGAPTLLEVNDTERGGQLEVVWQKRPAQEKIVGYTIYWDTAPGGGGDGYDFSKTAAAIADRAMIGGLVDGTPYYVVVTAEHCTREGPASNELTGTPHKVRGLNPPKSVGDLQVFRIPDSNGNGTRELRLTWSLPVETVWLIDVEVTTSEVYGSTSGPDFPVDETTLLATLSAGETEWVHEGNGEVPTNPWYYVVVTIGPNGDRSAPGVELPKGIDDLRLKKVNAGTQIEMQWSAIDRTIDDRRLFVRGYNVYGRSSNLGRRAVGPGNLIQSNVSSPPFVVGMPAAGYFTYQVLAVDSHGAEAVW